MVKQWGDFKDEIKSLYLNQRLSLRDVQTHMRDKHGFSASIRSYRGNLHDWGFKRIDNKTYKRSSHKDVRKTPVAISCGLTISATPVNARIDDSVQAFDYFLPLISTSETFDTSPPDFHLSRYSRTPSSTDSQRDKHQLDIENIPELVNRRTSLQQEHHSGRNSVEIGERDNFQDQNKSDVEDGLSRSDQLEDIVSLNNSQQGASSAFPLVLIEDDLGRTQLHLAAKYGSHTEVDSILRKVLDPKTEIERQDQKGDTPLHTALWADAPNQIIIELLLGYGADINKPNLFGLTPFHLLFWIASSKAVSEGSYISYLITSFLANGADVNSLTTGDNSPWGLFLRDFARLEPSVPGITTYLRIMEQFLMKGVDPNRKMLSGESLLEHLMSSSTLLNLEPDLYLNIIKILCKISNAEEMKSGKYYPLHKVLCWIQIDFRYIVMFSEILEVLLARGLDANQRNQKGLSPLAVLFNYETDDAVSVLRISRILLDAGANPLQYNLDGELNIYTGIRRHSEAIPELAILLLRAVASQTYDIPFFPNSDERPLPMRCEETHRWWQRTKLFLRSKFWHYAKDNITDSHDILPTDVKGVIIKAALEMVGRACVNYHKSQFDECKRVGRQKEMIFHGDYIIGMLADFRTLNLFKTETWLDLTFEIGSEMVEHVDFIK